MQVGALTRVPHFVQNGLMGSNPPRLRVGIRELLILVAVTAIHLWLFRISVLIGIVGLALTKHVLIAWLCQAIGVNRSVDALRFEHGPRSDQRLL
jgi:hypothetical protein